MLNADFARAQHRALRRWLWSMLLLVPFALGNKECGSNSHAGRDASTPGKDGGAGAFCGGLAGVGCPTGEYCNFTEQCGAADQGGHCTKIPDACTKEYHPVCGCDDKTYGNPCMAAAAGVSVLHEGTCEGPATGDAGSGRLCGTRGGQECGAGQYCKFSESAMCGRADAGGKCTALPQVCPDIVIPVCGCDNKTYNNECQAARAAGVGVLHSGACEPQPCDSCAGPMPGAPNKQCPDGIHFSGPACVTGDDGKCGWQILECPTESGSACDTRARDPGQCWTNEQCPAGNKCIGATCCPPNARCIVEDHPGTCQ